MKGAALRLALAAILFAGWLGYLAYLAATAAHPDVLSRPQFLVSSLDVIAQVEAADGRPSPTVRVVEVRRPSAEKKLEGQILRINNLETCDGWAGPGDYILALTVVGKDYEVTPTPRSPGYPPPRASAERSPPPRIYRLTPETGRQLGELLSRKAAS
jgi:hypothetical protein